MRSRCENQGEITRRGYKVIGKLNFITIKANWMWSTTELSLAGTIALGNKVEEIIHSE